MRITEKNVRRSVAHYARMLAGYGWERAALIDFRAPYGQVSYLLTYDETRPEHDVPGFTGSGGSGLTSWREAHARIHGAAAAVADYARSIGREFDHVAGSAAWVAVMDRLGLGDEVHQDERQAVTA